jgi:hypothetical protein
MPTEERSYLPVFITIIYLMAERGVRSYRAAKHCGVQHMNNLSETKGEPCACKYSPYLYLFLLLPLQVPTKCYNYGGNIVRSLSPFSLSFTPDDYS